MDRPGLQALLADIRKGLVDVIVVYKVDRLTRSLADFARIVELFDAYGVSFVSVTQAFNTTTSMGRLTLNVLLSFAQFEREVTGERIRDKIAASKAKGMWMGGRPPLGYDSAERKLVVNKDEAQIVQHIFERYLELGSVIALEADLRARKVYSKRWVTQSGEVTGGAPFGRGALYHLLANPVYRGAIRHKDRLYPDAHPAIVPESLWDGAQARLANNCPDHPDTPKTASDVLLRDRLFDDRGHLMSAVHATRRGKRYRYYASAALKPGSTKAKGSLPRIAMGVIDAFVIAQSTPLLAKGWAPDAPIETRVQQALICAKLGSEHLTMTFRHEAIIAQPATDHGAIGCVAGKVELAMAIRLKHRGGAAVIEGPPDQSPSVRIDRTLVRAITLAKSWTAQLASGEVASTRDLSSKVGLCKRYAGQLMPLAWLAPDLVEAILAGRQPAAVSLGALTRQPLPMDWDEQRRMFASLG